MAKVIDKGFLTPDSGIPLGGLSINSVRKVVPSVEKAPPESENIKENQATSEEPQTMNESYNATSQIAEQNFQGLLEKVMNGIKVTNDELRGMTAEQARAYNHALLNSPGMAEKRQRLREKTLASAIHNLTLASEEYNLSVAQVPRMPDKK